MTSLRAVAAAAISPPAASIKSSIRIHPLVMHLPMHLRPQIITDNTNIVIHPTPIAIHLLPIQLPILYLL
jgi:hypothetical protein